MTNNTRFDRARRIANAKQREHICFLCHQRREGKECVAGPESVYHSVCERWAVYDVGIRTPADSAGPS